MHDLSYVILRRAFFKKKPKIKIFALKQLKQILLLFSHFLFCPQKPQTVEHPQMTKGGLSVSCPMVRTQVMGWQTVNEFEQTPRDSEGQGSLMCCSRWGPKELGMTERLN